MKILLKIIVSALILVGSFNLRADANPDLWPIYPRKNVSRY